MGFAFDSRPCQKKRKQFRGTLVTARPDKGVAAQKPTGFLPLFQVTVLSSLGLICFFLWPSWHRALCLLLQPAPEDTAGLDCVSRQASVAFCIGLRCVTGWEPPLPGCPQPCCAIGSSIERAIECVTAVPLGFATPPRGPLCLLSIDPQTGTMVNCVFFPGEALHRWMMMRKRKMSLLIIQTSSSWFQ